jgi:hypothetical protein
MNRLNILKSKKDDGMQKELPNRSAAPFKNGIPDVFVFWL